MLKIKDFRQRMIIVGPPLVLLIVGAAVYIIVLKLTQPSSQVIEATPVNESSQSVATSQSSASANLTSVTTTVSQPSDSQISNWQSMADQGKEIWRLDPLQAAKQMGLDYGFVTSDPFSLIESSASANQKTKVIDASHQGKGYTLTMRQPGTEGAKGIWIIDKIEAK